ncbi:MAG: GNAT family N-acetyltransferase [Coprobacillus sp.]
MERITEIKDLDAVYEIFIEAFPPAELRLYEVMKQLYVEELLKIYVVKQDNQIVGAISLWELDQFIYVEHFAVSSSLRGQGLGSYFLKEVKSLYPQYQIVLEVEEPIQEIEKRRVEFYQRNDFVFNSFGYIQPPFRENVEDVYLLLMTYPAAINQEQFLHIKEQLFKKVYLVKD